MTTENEVAPKLSNKQLLFVQNYLIDKNATQAAIRAGYSVKAAQAIGAENLTKPVIKAAIKQQLDKIAKDTETEAQWVRRRLKEEAEDFSEFASHSARIKALELLGKINGVFEADNAQKAANMNVMFNVLFKPGSGPDHG